MSSLELNGVLITGGTGPSGNPGTTGPSGGPGQDGQTGAPGSSGPSGPAGPTGSPGTDGQTGAPGKFSILSKLAGKSPLNAFPILLVKHLDLFFRI